MSDGLRADAITAAQSPATGRFARLTRDSMLYASGAVVGKALGLVMLPILTRALTPEELGRFDVLSSLGSALIAILLLGADVAAIRLYFDRPTRRSRGELLTSWYLMAAVITLPVAAIIILARSTISVGLFDTEELASAVALVAIIVVTGTFQTLALVILRARGSGGQYGLLSSFALILNAVLTVGILLFWRQDATAALAALTISWTIGAIVGFLIIRTELEGNPTHAAARQLLALGLPMAPAVIVVFAADFLQRAILLNVVGSREVGYFAVAMRFGSVAALMVYGFQYAWQPRTYAAAAGAERRREFADARWILATVAVGTTIVAIFAPPLVRLVGGDVYAPAVPTTGLALIGAITLVLFMIESTPLLVLRKTTMVATATIVGTLVALALNVALAPRFGANATAASIALGQLGAAAIAWWMTPSRDRISGLARTVPTVVVAIAFVVGRTVLSDPYAWPVTLVAAVILAIALGLDGTAAAIIRLIRRLMRRSVGKPSE